MPNIRKATVAYTDFKNQFISQHNEKSEIINTIRRIERQAIAYNVDLSNNLESILLYDTTHISQIDYDTLTCFCLFKPILQEIAPCCFFFPALYAKHPFPLGPYVEAVKNELSW